jgi:hypothetical protein
MDTEIPWDDEIIDEIKPTGFAEETQELEKSNLPLYSVVPLLSVKTVVFACNDQTPEFIKSVAEDVPKIVQTYLDKQEGAYGGLMNQVLAATNRGSFFARPQNRIAPLLANDLKQILDYHTTVSAELQSHLTSQGVPRDSGASFFFVNPPDMYKYYLAHLFYTTKIVHCGDRANTAVRLRPVPAYPAEFAFKPTGNTYPMQCFAHTYIEPPVGCVKRWGKFWPAKCVYKMEKLASFLRAANSVSDRVLSATVIKLDTRLLELFAATGTYCYAYNLGFMLAHILQLTNTRVVYGEVGSLFSYVPLAEYIVDRIPGVNIDGMTFKKDLTPEYSCKATIVAPTPNDVFNYKTSPSWVFHCSSIIGAKDSIVHKVATILRYVKLYIYFGKVQLLHIMQGDENDIRAVDLHTIQAKLYPLLLNCYHACVREHGAIRMQISYDDNTISVTHVKLAVLAKTVIKVEKTTAAARNFTASAFTAVKIKYAEAEEQLPEAIIKEEFLDPQAKRQRTN